MNAYADGETVSYHGSPATVVRTETFSTPSGGSFVAVQIRRPRAGESWVMPDELHRPGESSGRGRPAPDARFRR